MHKTTILIVDDELVVRKMLGGALERAGYDIQLAASGAEALKCLEHVPIDLILLDLQLGDIDGVAVMEQVRQVNLDIPIIMLTAHGSLPSAIAAVRYDASDYLLKPIKVEVLRERVAEVLLKCNDRRLRNQNLMSMYGQMRDLLVKEGLLQQQMLGIQNAAGMEEVCEAGPLRIDVQKHTVAMHGQSVEVTPSEFAILLELLEHPGAVVGCTQLINATNTNVADEEEARQLIRPHIVRLRRKLEADPQQPRYLLSVRGIGYRWSADGAEG